MPDGLQGTTTIVVGGGAGSVSARPDYWLRTAPVAVVGLP
jgi:hypothetical protein